MLNSFLSFVREHEMLERERPVLLMVSGGVDSVVMSHLFYQTGFPFAIGHCNFRLRGRDSDADEKFVRDLADNLKVKLFIERFDTKKYAASKGISIQMAARELRIGWSDKILRNEDYSVYATAHHLDDELETFFLNLLRGTGLAGLKGMPPFRARSIRPMMFAWRSDIEKFAEEEAISFRTDKSNLETTYLRNKIRHWLVPALVRIDPAAKKTMHENIRRIRMQERIYEAHVQTVLDELIEEENGYRMIHTDKLFSKEHPEVYLFEILNPLGFTSETISSLITDEPRTSGSQFFSATHRLVIDRNRFLITKMEASGSTSEYPIHKETSEISEPLMMTFETIDADEEYSVSPDRNTAELDLEKLEFPLKLRKWKKGDFFYPLGMKGRKKVSDFFIDNKFSLLEKERTWILESAGKIVWIAGHRIDRRFAVSVSTCFVYRIAWNG